MIASTLIAAGFGVVVGLALGLTGGGGSIFAMPLLIYGLNLSLRFSAPCAFVLSVAGLGTGFLSGLFGVGGGFLIVPTLMLVTRINIHSAIATSLLIIIEVVVPAEVFLVLLDWQPRTFPRRQVVNDTICKLTGIGIDAVSRHGASTPCATDLCFGLLRELSICRSMATRAVPGRRVR